MKLRILASTLGLALLALLPGCSTVSPEQIKADVAQIGYGAALGSNWQDKIKSFMELRLKDPTSAIYKFGEPEQGYLTKAPIEGGGLKTAGYLVTVLINAKNSYGGYTGFEAHRFLLRDNEVVSYATQMGDSWFWQ